MFISRGKSLLSLAGKVLLARSTPASNASSMKLGIFSPSLFPHKRFSTGSAQCATIKLDYFNIRGFAEPIRMVLHCGGIKFEDVRSPLPSWPPKMAESDKAKYRWGQVPMVSIDGKELYQSLAITRFFARQCGLVPQDPYLAALCDEYVDTQREILIAWVPAVFADTASKKRLLCEEIYRLTTPRYLNVLEKIIKESSSGEHLVGDKLTWADIYMAYVFDHVEKLTEFDVIKKHPSIKKACDAVWNEPNIKKWKDSRPATPY
ncbi:Glutathione S-transferase [Orchesella cincta]|uniref:glutathione transferase n=1 Tax=Orchesella cincta TaxID=48709 RepID=A0A1D2MNL1_ORCCI|nr:Glutathione S-transferase [Orchesella cincta]